MERMAEFTDDMKYIIDLEEENKNLKEKIELLDNENMCLNAEIKDREEENKKLKEDVDYRHHRAMVAERGGEDED